MLFINKGAEWKQYFSDRKIKDCGDLYIIVPNEEANFTKVFCDICEYALRTSEDHESYIKNKCCSQCSLKWADKDVVSWKNGNNRPSRQEVDDYIKNERFSIINNNVTFMFTK